MNQHEPAAAEVSCTRQSYRKRKPDGHRRINCVTTVGQYVGASGGRRSALRGHHAGRSEDGVAQVLIANNRLAGCLSENSGALQQQDDNKGTS